MSRIAEDNDTAFGPGIQLGHKVEGPQVDALERNVGHGIGHDGGEVGAAFAQKIDAPGLVVQQLVPSSAVVLVLKELWLSNENLGAVSALRRNDKGAMLRAHDGHGQRVIGICLELRTRHGGGNTNHVCEFGSEIRVQVLADAGVNAIGSDEKLCAGGGSVGKGPSDGGGRFRDDVVKFLLVLDGNAGLTDHGHEDVDELEAVDAEGFVAVFFLGAEDEVVNGFVVIGMEVELLEVVAKGGDVLVYA